MNLAKCLFSLVLREGERRIHRQMILAQLRAIQESEKKHTTTSPPLSPAHL